MVGASGGWSEMLNSWSGVPGIVSGRVVPVLVETDVIYKACCVTSVILKLDSFVVFFLFKFS